MHILPYYVFKVVCGGVVQDSFSSLVWGEKEALRRAREKCDELNAHNHRNPELPPCRIVRGRRIKRVKDL